MSEPGLYKRWYPQLGLVNTPSQFIQMAISVLESITPKFIIIYIINIIIQIHTQGDHFVQVGEVPSVPTDHAPNAILAKCTRACQKVGF
jgi:hypothetical protein